MARALALAAAQAKARPEQLGRLGTLRIACERAGAFEGDVGAVELAHRRRDLGERRVVLEAWVTAVVESSRQSPGFGKTTAPHRTGHLIVPPCSFQPLVRLNTQAQGVEANKTGGIALIVDLILFKGGKRFGIQ